MLSAAGCTGELGPADRNPSEELATVKLSVGLDGVTGTRADADGILGDQDYETAETSPQISDGTRATTLIYALYKKESDGSRTPLPITVNPGKDEVIGSSYQVVRKNVHFPVDDIEFQLVKGFEYTLVFWAQSETEDIYKYYNTSDFGAIKVNYTAMSNNDELRDAFCAKHTITLTQDVENVNIILKRPFAQINVGMTKRAWDAVVSHQKTIKTSSIQLSGICDTFNLLEDNVVYDGASSLKEVNFTAETIPYDDTEHNTTKYLQVDLNRDGKINEYDGSDAEQFVWLSMCYVLVPGYTTSQGTDGESTTEYSTLVDLKNLYLNYEQYTDSQTGATIDAGSFNPGEVPNLPTLRNHRTNLILDQWPFGSKVITVDLCPEYNGDYNGPDYPGNENNDHTGANE